MTRPQEVLSASNSFSAEQICAVVNRFLISQVGSTFAAGTPERAADAHLWYVPVLYNPPNFVVGEVGQFQVDASTGTILKHTAIIDMQSRAATLHGRHKTQIRTAFLRARKK